MTTLSGKVLQLVRNMDADTDKNTLLEAAQWITDARLLLVRVVCAHEDEQELLRAIVDFLTPKK